MKFKNVFWLMSFLRVHKMRQKPRGLTYFEINLFQGRYRQTTYANMYIVQCAHLYMSCTSNLVVVNISTTICIEHSEMMF